MTESISVTSVHVKSSCKTDACGRRPEVKLRSEPFPQVSINRCGPEVDRQKDECPVNKGWETWASKMGGDCTDGASYNFDAEELAVRLGTRVDKAGKLHAKILLQKIYHFWHCRQHTDMVLIAGPVREEVHLHMFLAHSEFYEKIVMVPESEKMWREGKLVLDMTGMVQPKALKSIVSFIYTGAIKLTLDNVTDIAMASKAMGLRRLQEQCTEFLDYIFADFHLFTILRNVPAEHKFFDVAWTKILKRFRKVCCEPGFLNMDVDQLELMIASDKLNVESEYEVFRPVMNWINHNRQCRESSFFKLMAQVRFAYMDIDELIQCMQDEELFRTNCYAQKLLEDADMYATMESMGDEWNNYPPWPPRNDIIRRKVELRKLKLARLRPKTKTEICNECLPEDMQTDYGCRLPTACDERPRLDYSHPDPREENPQPRCGYNQPQVNDSDDSLDDQEEQRGEMNLFAPDPTTPWHREVQDPIRPRAPRCGKETSTNRTQLLAELRCKTRTEPEKSPPCQPCQEPPPPPRGPTTGPCAGPRRPKDLIRAWSGTVPFTTCKAKKSEDTVPCRKGGNKSRVRGPSEISLPAFMFEKRNL